MVWRGKSVVGSEEQFKYRKMEQERTEWRRRKNNMGREQLYKEWRTAREGKGGIVGKER